MPFISERVTREGLRHRVQWRHGGRQHVRSFLTREAAEKWMQRLDILGHAEALALLDKPPPPPDLPTVSQAVSKHIADLTGITDGTRRRYTQLQRNHIDPHLGDLPLDLLTYSRAAQWVNGLEKSGLLSKTIRNIHSLLSASVRTAVREGHVPENVVKGLRLPRSVKEEMIFLDVDEMLQFVGLVPPRWQPLVGTLFATGMRFGEATGLQVQHVNIARGEIRIMQAWKATSGSGHELGPPKSHRSIRTIGIPDSVGGALEGLMHRRGPRDWLFTNSHGGPVRHGSFHSHVWTPVVHEFAGDTRHETGVTGRRRWRWDKDGPGKRPRIHDARHTYAALAIATKGISPKALQAQLGHETITTTLDTYGHLYPAERDALAEVVPDLGLGRRLEA